MRVLFIGDVFAKQGILAIEDGIAYLQERYTWDFCIANAENAAGGRGLNARIVERLLNAGVHGLTSGNHIWARSEIMMVIDTQPNLARPLNYPNNNPGRGWFVLEHDDLALAVINLSGRVYMSPCDCPFVACECVLEQIKKRTQAIVVDMHAEATAEKAALAWHFDGRVSAVLGTHTHVQTADERILPNGTAFISDVGMTGPSQGIIGMDRETSILRLTTGMPHRLKSQKGDMMLHAVFLQIDPKTGRSTAIERISLDMEEHG